MHGKGGDRFGGQECLRRSCQVYTMEVSVIVGEVLIVKLVSLGRYLEQWHMMPNIAGLNMMWSITSTANYLNGMTALGDSEVVG